MKKLLGLLTLLLSMQVYAGTTENQVLDEAPESVELESGINLFNAQKAETLSDIALANVEALAGENPDDFNCWWDSEECVKCKKDGKWLGCPCGSHEW